MVNLPTEGSILLRSVRYERTLKVWSMISYGYMGGAMIEFRSGKSHDLNMSERMLVISLCSYANNEGVCWPSHKELVRVTGGSLSTIKRLLKSLSEKGYISIRQRRSEAGDLTTCLYQINIQKTEPKINQKVVPLRPGKTTEEKLFDVSWCDELTESR